MALTASNPLELPEILWRISRFVTMKDAVACARVCKSWTNDFVSAIWHTIDFAIHKELHTMDTKVLAKQGHHIRVVKNMKEFNHLFVLIVSNASKLRQLTVTMTATQKCNVYLSDLLRRNNTSIEHFDITQPSGGTAPFFTLDALFPMTSTSEASRLSSLKIQGLAITRDAFSALLKVCPSLHQLTIWNTTLPSWPIYDKSGTHCYQHTGITYLWAPIDQVFKMDDQSKISPSLLVHFPNLKTWEIWGTMTAPEIPAEELRGEVTRCCPLLKILWTSTPALTTASLVVQVFDNLTTIGVLNAQLSAELVMAIINHEESLTRISTYPGRSDLYTSDALPEVGSNQTTGWVIQALPRRCTQLKILRLPLYEMNMDDIEKAKWSCHDLEELRIRIKGLNTKEKIDRAIQLWTEGRMTVKKKQADGEQASISSSSQLDPAIPQGDNSIEARVARHLLKFKKLREVWLGWKVRKVA